MGGENNLFGFNCIDNQLIDMRPINYVAELRSNVDVRGLRGDKGCVSAVYLVRIFFLERVWGSDANRMYNTDPMPDP